MKKILAAIIFLFSTFINSQNNLATLSGFIYDEGNGETLIGANIFVPELNMGTSSNVYGFYSLSLPPGKYTIEISFVGFTKLLEVIMLHESEKKDFHIKRSAFNLDEVVVVDKKNYDNIRSTELGTKTLQPQNLEQIPLILGEKDILKTIQLLPGISSAGEGNSGFVVRGGTPDQNLIILDEAPVYNPSHLLGFFSVFNSDAIKSAKIIKGIPGAEYGGRISSVLDINMKDGNNKEFDFYGGVGLLSSRLTIEGPIYKNKGSFIVSGRRTYLDIFFPLTGDKKVKNSNLYFYDLNVKLNYKPTESNKFFISAYTGRDLFDFNNEFGFDWGNTTATFRWNKIFGDKLFSNLTLLYSKYNYDLQIQDRDESVKVHSGIEDASIKEDLQYYHNSNNTFKLGLQTVYHTFQPGSAIAEGNTSYNSHEIRDAYALESNLYGGHETNISPLIKLSYGLRFSNFTLLGPATLYSFNPEGDLIKESKFENRESIKSYNYFEPRLSVNYLFDMVSSIKFGYARNTQNIHLLSTTTTSTPLDLWQPSTKIIKPQISDLLSLGYYRNLSNNQYSASFEVYYKSMQNLIDYKNGADIFLNELIESQLVFGTGFSYGVEFFVEKKAGNFTGWISYTLSTSQRKFDKINDGNTFPARNDRTHDISIVTIYNINKRWTLSANWIYYTGLAATYPSGKYHINGKLINLYSDRNEHRMPDYHRLDFGATYYFSQTPHSEMSITFSLYNLYGRKNAYTISFKSSKDIPDKIDAVKLSLFSIVPSITFNFRF